MIALLLGAAPADAATPGEWQQDLGKLAADVKATHPNPFGKVGELNFIRALEALRGDLATLSEEQRMARAMALVALIGDGHTQLQPNSTAFARWYPFRLYEFSDGYFFTGAHKSQPDLAGAQLLQVNGRPAAEAVTAARRLMGADNGFDSKERLYAIHNAGLMKGLGLAAPDGTLRLRLRLRNGSIVDRRIAPLEGQSATFDWTVRPEYWGAVGTPEDWISAFRGLTAAQLRESDRTRPAHLIHRRAFYAGPLAGGRSYYIQANLVGGTADESFPAFFRRALGEVDRLRPVNLIVDIRQNFGGDGSNVLPVVHQFIERKSKAPWTNLYLLTGRRTFSAGVLMAADLIEHMRPTIVGEPAGAPLNSYGDANAFDYAATGMRLNISFERHQKGKSTDISAIIPVDYPASFSFADYAAGRDPAVDPIITGREVRSIPAIAAADGAAAAFAAFRDRSSRFSREVWRPTSELDLRTIMRELDDAGRRDAAIEVARLNTQINAGEWRTWMNLGDLLLRAGREPEAIENYRRSLALNDPTNFNKARLERLVRDFESKAQQPAAQPQTSG